jgi:ATP-dependent helicase HrpA
VLGLARLFQAALKTQSKYLRKHMPHIQQSCMLYREIDDCTALTQNLLDVSFVRTFHIDATSIRDERTFNAQLEQHKSELVTIANEMAELVFKILQHHHRIRSALKGPSLPSSLHEDIDSQLNCLVYPNFIRQTDYARLCHYPRYLQAVEKRLEKFKRNPERDHQLQDKLQPYWEQALQFCNNNNSARNPNEQAADFRWMVEEWRVSLFAQELKTPISVSEKRLQELQRRLGT